MGVFMLEQSNKISDYKEFDEVSIINPANIRWLFTNRGDLTGSWVVTGIVGDELIISRNGLLISIHYNDVKKTSTYSIDALLDHIKRSSGYG